MLSLVPYSESSEDSSSESELLSDEAQEKKQVCIESR